MRDKLLCWLLPISKSCFYEWFLLRSFRQQIHFLVLILTDVRHHRDWLNLIIQPRTLRKLIVLNWSFLSPQYNFWEYKTSIWLKWFSWNWYLHESWGCHRTWTRFFFDRWKIILNKFLGLLLGKFVHCAVNTVSLNIAVTSSLMFLICV